VERITDTHFDPWIRDEKNPGSYFPTAKKQFLVWDPGWKNLDKNPYPQHGSHGGLCFYAISGEQQF
jgi:hypothetical protein